MYSETSVILPSDETPRTFSPNKNLLLEPESTISVVLFATAS